MKKNWIYLHKHFVAEPVIVSFSSLKGFWHKIESLVAFSLHFFLFAFYNQKHLYLAVSITRGLLLLETAVSSYLLEQETRFLNIPK